MKLTENQKAFLIDNKEALLELFKVRINSLRELNENEPDRDKRDVLLESIRENKYWIREVEQNTTKQTTPKTDTGI